MKKKKEYQSFKAGDIFRFPVSPTEFGFGRVLLLINDQCFKPGLIDWQSKIYFQLEDTIYIELFSNISTHKTIDPEVLEVGIPGFFTSNVSIEEFDWIVVDSKEIDPTQVDFPEFLSADGSRHGQFIKGEVTERLEIDWDRIREIDLARTIIPSMIVPELVLFLHGRYEEMRLTKGKYSARDMQFEDLRFSKYREEIYALLPEEFNQPYYDLAKSRGFDLKRFYE
jgi:Immunity protein 26